MAMKKYNEYLQVNPSFESVVDIAADSRNKNLWREYIVGDDMEKLMDFLCQTLGYETPDARRSLWVHGSYGTGKSYAAILIKHLLEEKKDTIDTFLQNSQRLSKYRNRFLNCRKNGDYLVFGKPAARVSVPVTSCWLRQNSPFVKHWYRSLVIVLIWASPLFKTA